MNGNIRRLGVFFLVTFAIIVGDVTYWQVIDASNLQARADNPRLTLREARIQRGFIYDRNGAILANRTTDPQGFVHRSYTDPTLSQVIGYDNPRYGKSGLEAAFDPYLSGQVLGGSWSSFVDRVEHKPVIGDDLTLTIDDRLQRQVDNMLPSTPSAAIVADPRNGEILAMAGHPGFDANLITDPAYWNSLLSPASGAPLIDRPINGYYPPGSTFKVVTITGALDTHIMSLSTEFSGEQATGPLVVGNHVFCDNITHPCAPFNNLAPYGVTSVDLEHALMYSDNIVFARVGLALGKDRFTQYAHRFGVDQLIPFDLPVSVSHLTTRGEVFDDVELAATAFGQGGLNVTPLQMLMTAEAQADGGTIPRPILVKEVAAPDGTTVKSADEGTLFTSETADTASQVRDAMVQVVQAGSGFMAQIPGVQVAAKTGTAETQHGTAPHAWFIAFAPADHPRIAVAVIIEHGGEGAFVAAPVAKKIIEAALALTH